MSDDRPRIGISSCLLGEPVRFDAGHKRDAFLVDIFGQHVVWAPVCPEMEAGFGTPRPAMRLVATTRRRSEQGVSADAAARSLIVIKTGEDVTERLRGYSTAKAETLVGAGLSGYILKKDSPSCGMARVKVYSDAVPERSGRGLFAEALMTRLPNLPIEEEGRLSDPRLRENFIERVFAYRRLRTLFESSWTVGQLVAFHTAHKLTLMAHSPVAYRTLGQMVAAATPADRISVAADYERTFMQALAQIATPKRHANVLQHMFGYFSETLAADARREVLDLIEEHRVGRVPLIVPMTLIRHYVRLHNVRYLAGQSYLEPHPRELSLRNHV